MKPWWNRGTLVEPWWNPSVEPSRWNPDGTLVETSWNPRGTLPQTTPDHPALAEEPWWNPGGNLVEPWWNPGGTLAEPLVEPWWNLTSGPPRTLSGLRPQSFQLLGKKTAVCGGAAPRQVPEARKRRLAPPCGLAGGNAAPLTEAWPSSPASVKTFPGKSSPAKPANNEHSCAPTVSALLRQQGTLLRADSEHAYAPTMNTLVRQQRARLCTNKEDACAPTTTLNMLIRQRRGH